MINHHQSEMMRRQKKCYTTARWTGGKRQQGGVIGQWVGALQGSDEALENDPDALKGLKGD